MKPGDVVLFRSVYRGDVRWCFPSRYAGDWNGRHGLYCQPGIGDHLDTTDWALDVWVEPDGSRRWKDEADFAETQGLGILDAAGAAEVRAEREGVIAARPWPTGWERWRPPPEWGPLPLPEDWHVV